VSSFLPVKVNFLQPLVTPGARIPLILKFLSAITQKMQTKDKLLHPAGPDGKNIETEEGSHFSLTDEGCETTQSFVSQREKVKSGGSAVFCCSASGHLQQLKEASSSEQTAHDVQMTACSEALEETKGQVF
jgi:hypothetical protein